MYVLYLRDLAYRSPHRASACTQRAGALCFMCCHLCVVYSVVCFSFVFYLIVVVSHSLYSVYPVHLTQICQGRTR